MNAKNFDSNVDTVREGSANLDPISGAPGAHPIGTGVGAVLGGAAAGAATGTVAGPVGTVIGAAVGAIIGGLAGKGVAEAVDPTVEEAYWRDNFSSRPYVDSSASYDDYGPAYGYGVDSFGKTKTAALTMLSRTCRVTGTRRVAHPASRGTRPRTPAATRGTRSATRPSGRCRATRTATANKICAGSDSGGLWSPPVRFHVL